MLALLCMWLGISTPLIFLGYYFGYRKQVSYQTVGNMSCKTLPILEWLGPLKFTPVKFGGVGYWMVDKPQISYVVDSWTRSFKIKVKIKVKEHLYCISLRGWVGYCMHLGIVFQFGFLLSKPCFPGMYLWFHITPSETLHELGAFYYQWLVLPMKFPTCELAFCFPSSSQNNMLNMLYYMHLKNLT